MALTVSIIATAALFALLLWRAVRAQRKRIDMPAMLRPPWDESTRRIKVPSRAARHRARRRHERG